MNACDILAISDPSRLFGVDQDMAKKKFRKLVAFWHPDVSDDPRAAEVMAHISALRGRIVRASAQAPTHSEEFTRKDGTKFALKYHRINAFDAGRLIISSRTLSTHWLADYSDLAKAEVDAISGFSFADERMKAQFARFLPKLIKDEELEDGHLTVVERKPADILLADILTLRGALPARHAAWICSGLLNIACWLQWSGRVHGAIAPENILIDPQMHDVRLIGGWAFSTHDGTRPSALPDRTLQLIPRLAIPGQTVDHAVDLELIRLTICECLGDPTGMGLIKHGLPDPIRGWLLFPPSGSAFEDYKAWGEALDKAWGKRSFIEYDLKASDFYGWGKY